MPDMRDAIAQYLAFQGGQMPQGGMPQGFSPSPPGPNPGGPVPPPPPEFYNGGRDIFAPDPSIPSNLQDYQQLPSGQFLPQGQQVPVQVPPLAPGDMPGPQEPPMQPPVNTPMQAPQGQLVGGMDPQQWLRMYRGG